MKMSAKDAELPDCSVCVKIEIQGARVGSWGF